MKKWIVVGTLIGVFGIVALVLREQNSRSEIEPPKEFVVYAYSSFVASWGVGPKLQEQFKLQTGVDLKLVDVGDTALMIARMEKEGLAAADVWLGMDQAMAEEASLRFKWWSPPQQALSFMTGFPESEFQLGGVTAFDWAPLAFIYNTKRMAPPKLEEIFQGHYDKKVTSPDPALSPLGLELVRWLAGNTQRGEPIENLKSLKQAGLLFGRSWSQSYGIFQKGEALLSWSFLTSPVYHWVEEKDESYQPLVMPDGHPFIIEYFGIPAESVKKDLAQIFVEMILSEKTQKLLMEKNYMFPIRSGVTTGTRFEDLPKVKIITPLIEADAALALWNKVK